MSKPAQWAVKQHLEKNWRCEWVCVHTKLSNLGEQKGQGVKYFKDGSKWCATLEDFRNLQEDPAGFGGTKKEALDELRDAIDIR